MFESFCLNKFITLVHRLFVAIAIGKIDIVQFQKIFLQQLSIFNYLSRISYTWQSQYWNKIVFIFL